MAFVYHRHKHSLKFTQGMPLRCVVLQSTSVSLSQSLSLFHKRARARTPTHPHTLGSTLLNSVAFSRNSLPPVTLFGWEEEERRQVKMGGNKFVWPS